MPRLTRILVPVDFAPASRAALDYAIFLAERFGARVDVLHVWRTSAALSPEVVASLPSNLPDELGAVTRNAAEESMTQLLASCVMRPGVAVDGRVVFGFPPAVIRKESIDGWYDLVVMGTHGRTGLSRVFLGSVAEEVTRHAPCPVLTIHDPEAPSARLGARQEGVST